MSFSKSKSKASTTSTTTQKNLNIQDTEGVTIGETGGDVSVILTDHNAFDNASELARKSLDVGAALQAESLAAARFSAEQAFDFGGAAISAIERAFAGAAEFVGGTSEALTSTFREQSKSTDERVAELAQGAQKNIVLLVGIVAVALLGYSIFKGR